jgi:hypothetical protein
MTRFKHIGRIGQMLAIALAWCLWPTSAQAQGPYACPTNLGPGERWVGNADAGPTNPPVRLCVRDDAGGPPAQPAGPSNSFAAIGWHPDAADIWADGNYVNGSAGGSREVLALCEKAMGGGCSIAATWSNSSMTIFRDREGYFHKGWNAEGGAERKQVLADCSARQLLPCEVFATIRSDVDSKSPKGPVRKSYAAAAAVKGPTGYDGKLYIVSGFQNATGVSAAAEKACADFTKRVCETRAFSGNGFIQVYRLNDNVDRATPETSAKRAKQAAELDCKQQRATCKLQAQFDSRERGLFVHDFVTGQTHR